MQLVVSVTTEIGYKLVSSGVWAGEETSQLPKDGSGKPSASHFPHTWTNSGVDTESWTTIVMVNRSRTCAENMPEFGLTLVTQVTVESSSGQGIDAYAVENNYDGTGLYDGTSLVVECECVKEVVQEKCISPIDTQGKYCRTLMTNTSESVGNVCIEVLEEPDRKSVV